MIKTNGNEIIFGGTCGKDLDVKNGNNKPFGLISVVQTTSWKKPDDTGFNQRDTWMNLKFNDFLIKKIQRNNGLFKGDEILVKGYLVQRKIGEQGHIITEIQVETILSIMPKSLKELSKNIVPQHAPQNNAPHQAQQPAPQNNAPHQAQQPAPQNIAQHNVDQEYQDFFGSKQQ